MIAKSAFQYHVQHALESATSMRAEGIRSGNPGRDPNMAAEQLRLTAGPATIGGGLGSMIFGTNLPKVHTSNLKLIGTGAMWSARQGRRELEQAAKAATSETWYTAMPAAVNDHLDSAVGHLQRALDRAS